MSYIGIAYNKTTSTESSNYLDYDWTLIKGEDGKDATGTPGEDGRGITSITTQYVLSTDNQNKRN